MKKIYLISFLLCLAFSLLAQTQQSKVTKTLVPLLSNVPVVYQDNVQGGLHAVADQTERDALPATLREPGMLVYVTADLAYYQWDGTVWNKVMFVQKWAENAPYSIGSVFLYNNVFITAKTAGTIGATDNPITDLTNWNADGAFANLTVGNPTIDKITITGKNLAVEGDSEFDGSVWIQGAANFPSDVRLKKNIATLTGVLGKISQLRGVSYEFIDQHVSATGPQIGVIAQELQKVYPELVNQAKDGYLAVNYTMLTAVLIQATKEQQAQIDELKLQMDVVMKKLRLKKKTASPPTSFDNKGGILP